MEEAIAVLRTSIQAEMRERMENLEAKIVAAESEKRVAQEFAEQRQERIETLEKYLDDRREAARLFVRVETLEAELQEALEQAREAMKSHNQEAADLRRQFVAKEEDNSNLQRQLEEERRKREEEKANFMRQLEAEKAAHQRQLEAEKAELQQELEDLHQVSEKLILDHKECVKSQRSYSEDLERQIKELREEAVHKDTEHAEALVAAKKAAKKEGKRAKLREQLEAANARIATLEGKLTEEDIKFLEDVKIIMAGHSRLPDVYSSLPVQIARMLLKMLEEVPEDRRWLAARNLGLKGNMLARYGEEVSADDLEPIKNMKFEIRVRIKVAYNNYLDVLRGHRGNWKEPQCLSIRMLFALQAAKIHPTIVSY